MWKAPIPQFHFLKGSLCLFIGICLGLVIYFGLWICLLEII